MTKAVNERELILAVLLEVTEHGQFSHIVLRETLSKYQYLEKRERAFITRVTEGTLEHLIEIDYILNQFSTVKVGKMKPVIRNLLRSAVYQMKYMDSVPHRAVCSESVKLAAKKGFSGLRGYVNGVLRSIARGIEDIEYPSDETEFLSVRYSCPRWIIDMWQKHYGIHQIRMMLQDFEKAKPTTVRCCVSRCAPEELEKRLREERVRTEPHPYLPYAFYITGYDHLEALSAFREGLFVVQDVSSMLVGELADATPGDQIIDVCAAPGGKSFHLAEKLQMAERNAGYDDGEKIGRGQGSGHVTACDVTEYKVGLIQESVERLKLDNVSAVCRDASLPDESWRGRADIVIADLPCSGLGVLGRKADLKYNASPDGIRSLISLQRQILSCAKDLVKPGGVLLYSTCTVNPEENIENVHWFLEENPQFEQADIRELLCPELRESVEEKGCLQLFPGVHKSDGFFIAKLVKKRKSGTV